MKTSGHDRQASDRVTIANRVDTVCDLYEQQWIKGNEPKIEDYLGDAVEPERTMLMRELLAVEREYLQKRNDRALANVPVSLGRFRVEKCLGEGAFGRVYLAFDERLERFVAVKVIHASVTSKVGDSEAYLAEARMLARLDHPNIVPVFDADVTESGQFYIVSKFLEGRNLAERIRAQRLRAQEAAVLTATVAEALHHAHSRGLVHCDIKPQNILFDLRGVPYLTDFGLALREDRFHFAADVAGTPLYMSPEQARAETHLLDARSDVFSLGVVLYELLSSSRPFAGRNTELILEEVRLRRFQRPRERDPSIPQELDRICLKAMSYRAADRFQSMREMADDLRRFLNSGAADVSESDRLSRIIPRGLRCFDSHDHDFFLDLLPGPRDRQGLPEIVSFWKSRIERHGAASSFRVGLLYGPSGAGKSSLVKAGVLPRLSNAVTSIYTEATTEETEGTLLRALHNAWGALSTDIGLTQAMRMIRRGEVGLPLCAAIADLRRGRRFAALKSQRSRLGATFCC